jgi:hypothetical protein
MEEMTINWDGLCEYAATKNISLPCTILPDKFGGGRHIVKLLSFNEDISTLWIARIQREPSTDLTASCLRTEIDTMEFIRMKTEIRMPKIYAYELYDTNIVGAPFMLMEYIHGKSGMDFDHGHIPLAQKSQFYKDVATIQVSFIVQCYLPFKKLISFSNSFPGNAILSEVTKNRFDYPPQ